MKGMSFGNIMARFGEGFKDSRVSLLLALLCLLVWSAGFLWRADARSVDARAAVQEGRFLQLMRTLSQYQALPHKEEKKEISAVDALGALSRMLDRLALRDRVAQFASSGTGIAVQVERLYGEELGRLLQELGAEGFSVRSAELKVLPFGGEKLYLLSLLVGVGQ